MPLSALPVQAGWFHWVLCVFAIRNQSLSKWTECIWVNVTALFLQHMGHHHKSEGGGESGALYECRTPSLLDSPGIVHESYRIVQTKALS